MTARASDCKHA